MVVIPKLNYLFSMLPINIPTGIFKTMDKNNNPFSLGGKETQNEFKNIAEKRGTWGIGSA